jgi:hypothetical protein
MLAAFLEIDDENSIKIVSPKAEAWVCHTNPF